MWPFNAGLGLCAQRVPIGGLQPPGYEEHLAHAQNARRVAESKCKQDIRALERIYEMRKDPVRMKVALESLKTEHDDSKKRAAHMLKVFKMFKKEGVG